MSKPFQSSNFYYGYNILGFIFGYQFCITLILHCPFSFVGPYIFLNIFLSHVINIFFNFTCQSSCLCSICHSWSYESLESVSLKYHLVPYKFVFPRITPSNVYSICFFFLFLLSSYVLNEAICISAFMSVIFVICESNPIFPTDCIIHKPHISLP
jgi:hypothetical protein